jgi:hypothetical protein
MNGLIERLAEWYLRRRGRVVLPRLFVGLVVGGNATAWRRKPYFKDVSEWNVTIPECGDVIALNGSTVTYWWQR